MRTEKQTKALEIARKYKDKNYLTEQFGKQYLAFCDEGYVKPNKFLGYVTEKNTVIPIKSVVAPTMSFDKYLDVIIRQAKGK
jgi:ferritin